MEAERRARALKGAETRRVNKAARDAKAAEEKNSAAEHAIVRANAMEVPRSNAGPLAPSSHVVGHEDVQMDPMIPLVANGHAQTIPTSTASSTAFPEIHANQPDTVLSDTARHANNTTVYPQYQYIPQNVNGLQYDPVRDSTAPWSLAAEESATSGFSIPLETHLAQAYPHAFQTPCASPTRPSSSSAQNLPVFTSTGHIPFAAPGSNGPFQQAGKHPGYSGQTQSFPQPHWPQQPIMWNGTGDGVDNSGVNPHQGQQEDIWMVPDTPGK